MEQHSTGCVQPYDDSPRLNTVTRFTTIAEHRHRARAQSAADIALNALEKFSKDFGFNFITRLVANYRADLDFIFCHDASADEIAESLRTLCEELLQLSACVSAYARSQSASPVIGDGAS